MRRTHNVEWTAETLLSIYHLMVSSQTMNPIASILDRHSALVIDGALATELERRGCDLKDDLWSAKVLLEQPEAIKQVHFDYFKAGADCAITASYQATIEGFAKRGLNEKEAIALIQKSVKLAMEARDEFWDDKSNRVGRSKRVFKYSPRRTRRDTKAYENKEKPE